MKKYYVFFFLIIIFSCEFNDRSNRPKSVKFLDLMDAEYLALEKESKKEEGNSTWSNLYKLVRNEQGLSSQKIGFQDENGEIIDSEFTNIYVDEIYPVSDDYICFSGRFEIKIDSSVESLVYSSLLVNLIDGSIYDFNGHIPNFISYCTEKSRLQQDGAGNIYYNYGEEVYKLGINQDFITQELYVSSSQIQHGDYFYISSDANCYFNAAGKSRVKLSSGGILILDGLYIDVFGSKGRVFARSFYYTKKLYELKLVDNVCFGEEIHHLNYEPEELIYLNETDEYSYIINKSIITPDIYEGVIGFVFDFESDSLIELAVLDVINEGIHYDIVNCRDLYMWACSSGSLNKQFIRYDLTKFHIETPYPTELDRELGVLNTFILIEFPSNLEVTSYQFIENDEISFRAFDLSEEKDVTGIINMESEITITNVEDNYTLEILKRLNK